MTQKFYFYLFTQMKICPHKDLYLYIHCSFIHNGLKLEILQIVHQLMSGLTAVVQPCNAIVLSNSKDKLPMQVTMNES